jgi:glycosyltransferase involved in cell wall biosynthesis
MFVLSQENRMPKIAVIVPAKNEAENICSVIEDIIRNSPQSDIIVVDDHSSDLTADNARAYPQVTVLVSPISLGIGGAVQLGVIHALEKGYDTLVRIDGDGQHNALFINNLLAKVNETTLVIGARNHTEFKSSSDIVRKFGWIYFRLLFRLFTCVSIQDPTSGFVCFGKKVAEKFAKYYPLDFPEIESTALLIRAGHTVICEKVQMNPRKKGNSSISAFYSIIYMITVSLAFFISFFKKNPYGAT